MITINGTTVNPGEYKRIQIDIAKLYDFTSLDMHVHVICGETPGPTLFVSAAIHGDEINGVEIIRRLIKRRLVRKISGTLIAVPVVNIFGFNNKSRYLPDRRDLNRCFPGSNKSSLASQIAHIFMKEIVNQSTHGIDLHTGAVDRANLPQIRACLDDNPETLRLAKAFGTPVVLNSDLRDGSLRTAANNKNIPILVYEAGEALRFDEQCIQQGVRGIINVMYEMGMFKNSPGQLGKDRKQDIFIAQSSMWTRAPESGVFRSNKKLGAMVKRDERLGVVADPFGDNTIEVQSRTEGIIIGKLQLPLVNRGDALFHIATFEDLRSVEQSVDDFDYDYDMILSGIHPDDLLEPEIPDD